MARQHVGVVDERARHFDPEHLRAALDEGGASAALAASIFHYREFTIEETKEYLHRHGLPVRRVAPAVAVQAR